MEHKAQELARVRELAVHLTEQLIVTQARAYELQCAVDSALVLSAPDQSEVKESEQIVTIRFHPQDDKRPLVRLAVPRDMLVPVKHVLSRAKCRADDVLVTDDDHSPVCIYTARDFLPDGRYWFRIARGAEAEVLLTRRSGVYIQERLQALSMSVRACGARVYRRIFDKKRNID